MHEEPVLDTIVAVVGLLLVASATAIALKRLRLPYTVGLVVVGLGLGALAPHVGALEPLTQVTLSPDIIMFVFLPTLVFESAFNLDSRVPAFFERFARIAEVVNQEPQTRQALRDSYRFYRQRGYAPQHLHL